MNWIERIFGRKQARELKPELERRREQLNAAANSRPPADGAKRTAEPTEPPPADAASAGA